jgi:membrane protein required for beta-lactamase induction
MIAILLALGTIAFVIVVSFNTHVIGLALENCVRLDGSISRKRIFKEIKHLSRYYAAISLVVAILMGVVYTALVVIDDYLIPISIVGDVFSLFDPDPVAWEEAIKRGPMGNLDQRFEDWSARRGYDSKTPEIWADVLFQNWLSILIIALAIIVMLYVIQVKVFTGMTRYYEMHTLLRRRAYLKKDRQRTEEMEQQPAE